MKINWKFIQNDIALDDFKNFIINNRDKFSAQDFLCLNLEYNRQLNNANEWVDRFVSSQIFNLSLAMSDKDNLTEVLDNMVKIRDRMLRNKKASKNAKKRWSKSKLIKGGNNEKKKILI